MQTFALERRGFQLGKTSNPEVSGEPKWSTQLEVAAWESGSPTLLSQFVQDELVENKSHIIQTDQLYQKIIAGGDCDELLAKEPYRSRIDEQFDALGSAFNEGSEQEVQTLFFDAIEDGKILAEDLWIKISRLSFYKGEQSLRFRFSFGIDFEEDVASDKVRQYFASLLTDAVFPECQIIAENSTLSRMLCALLKVDSVDFVERIVYFNAVNGGAYLHHDRERGHAGVVYAQLTGMTYWIALPRGALVKQVSTFIKQATNHEDGWLERFNTTQKEQLFRLAVDPLALITELESFSNDALISLINETPEFINQLVSNGFGQVVSPGDLIILPQDSEENCCWHSVFNLGETAGQALSFAIRESVPR